MREGVKKLNQKNGRNIDNFKKELDKKKNSNNFFFYKTPKLALLFFTFFYIRKKKTLDSRKFSTFVFRWIYIF